MTDAAVPFAPDRPCPLDGVRVLDLSRLVCGNMLTLQLADFGAEVIKLEPPEGDPLRHWREEGVSVHWKIYGRNKKSVRFDLRTEDGKALLRRLLPTAHVLVEGFRPGVMEAAGFSPDRLLALNSRLVVVRISGFARRAVQGGHDLMRVGDTTIDIRRQPGLNPNRTRWRRPEGLPAGPIGAVPAR